MCEVSIIMGVYNCKDINKLKKSILSIITQTYTEWELIICNDGSTDDTLIHLKNFAKLDNRIKIISYTPNRGLAYALNKCFSVAKGKFIARQDDDDISKPERLQKEVDFLKNNLEYAFVCTNCTVYDNNSIWGKIKFIKSPTKKDFLWNSPFLHPSLVIRKEYLQSIGGYCTDVEVNRCEDYDLFMRLYANGYKGYNLQENLYQYFISIGNKKYRPMKDRISEARTRWKGFKLLQLFPVALPYVIKPILIGLIPQFIFKRIRRNTLK